MFVIRERFCAHPVFIFAMRKSNLCDSCHIYVQVNFSPEQAKKTQTEGVSIQLYSFFNLGVRSGWVFIAIHTAALPPGKETRYPLYRGLGGPKGPSGRLRIISLPNWIRSSDRPARSESLWRLSYRGPPKIDVRRYLSYRLCFILTESR